MPLRVGKYLVQKTGNEIYKIYLPAKLPIEIQMDQLYSSLEKATLALGELNNLTKNIPNPLLFIYMYVRKEALLSSQIEGTQSSFSDLILFESQQMPNVSLDDVEEVSNYVKAINYGIKKLKNGFPLSLRLIREIHAILLSGMRGDNKSPGEFRKSQNWIGGTRPGNALFVPPSPELMMKFLGNLEEFFHNPNQLALIKAGISHAQFETIHPFLDGNGRIGRLLIILLLYANGVLEEPILYLSLYLKQNRNTYYNLLQDTRDHGAWEAWLEFFLDGIYQTSKQAIETIKQINELFVVDQANVGNLGRIRFSCTKVLKYMQKLPQVSVDIISRELKISAPTARSVLNCMVKIEVLQEITGKKRDKIYVYKNYLNILEENK